MKTIKYVVFLIVLAFIGILVYQNIDYFMAANALAFDLDLKLFSFHFTIPELQNIALLGICLLAGLILAGFRGFLRKLNLKKQIKIKDKSIKSLNDKIQELQSELDVFKHDPYIKKGIEQKQLENIQATNNQAVHEIKAQTVEKQESEKLDKQEDTSDTADDSKSDNART